MISKSWDEAEMKECSFCKRVVKVWSPFKAWAAGEETTRLHWSEHPHIQPDFKGYEDVCTNCRHEDILSRYKFANMMSYEEQGKPIPKWLLEL
jgi:hypothetical protein